MHVIAAWAYHVCMTTEELIDVYAEDLSAEQEEAFRHLVWKLLEPGAAHYKLEGYAGTGKTYVAARICRVLQRKGIRLAAAAPTHRATSEIRRALSATEERGLDGIETRTLPALLGLQLTGDGEGGYHLVPEGEAHLPEGGVVICDEGSMVGQETMGYVRAAGHGVRWLFLGDPAQLPPVGEEPSAVFDLPGASLTRIVRQAAGNPIIEFTRRIREREAHLGPEHLVYDGEEGIAATRSERAFLESALRVFSSPTFEEDPHAGRILAYRNAVVDRYNRLVRNAIYGEDAEEYVPGEWLVARETWMRDSVPVVINSEALKVIEAHKGTDSFALGGQWTVWRLVVESERWNEREVVVLADEDRAAYREAANRYRDDALDAKKNDDRDAASGAWKNYYRLMEQYARVDYGFSTTVHKSQGGTFDSVFVDYRDLDRSREPERSALKYVAGSRPRRRLALLI